MLARLMHAQPMHVDLPVMERVPPGHVQMAPGLRVVPALALALLVQGPALMVHAVPPPRPRLRSRKWPHVLIEPAMSTSPLGPVVPIPRKTTVA
jgi:hypothetical protein